MEASTPPRPVTESHWRSCDVWTLYLENCANARRINVFWVINPLFLTHPGVRYNRQPLHDLSRRVIEVPVKFELRSLKTVQMHVELTFFEWLPLCFWPIWGYGGIVNPSTTCHGQSLTFLWSLNSVSWKLCERTSNYVFWVIDPLFLTHLGVRWNRQPLHDLYRRVIEVPVKFELRSLKLCECTSN